MHSKQIEQNKRNNLIKNERKENENENNENMYQKQKEIWKTSITK